MEALVYLLIVNVLAMVICCIDKTNAKRGKRRIPEKSLFLLCFLGGGPLMYLTMNLIRHKTLHKRFMIGIPLILILQILIAVFIKYYL